MRSIRLLDESAVDELLRIMRNAYPGVPFAPLDTHREQTLEEIRDNATVELFGVFEGERMVACFRIHDFTMNCLGTPIPVGGIGGIAVDLAHKKE
ncbi:MAG: GNAT family N-acetyltransferase, partial [Planctomycetota bacterium]